MKEKLQDLLSSHCGVAFKELNAYKEELTPAIALDAMEEAYELGKKDYIRGLEIKNKILEFIKSVESDYKEYTGDLGNPSYSNYKHIHPQDYTALQIMLYRYFTIDLKADE